MFYFDQSVKKNLENKLDLYI